MSIDLAGLFFGGGQACRDLLDEVVALAPTPCPVLLTGATGTGKTALARSLHLLSPRRDGPFIERSVSLVPEGLRHAEFLGYRRGSFTGALQDHAGYIESAHHGTLFLDELGFMSLKLQQLLLTLIEGKSVQRMQEARARPVDVRFVLATTVDLDEMQKRNRLLPEFRYRLGEFVLRLPRLRDRPEDIPPLAIRFLHEGKNQMGKRDNIDVTPEAMALLVAAPWPGNIRQLQSACWWILAHAPDLEAIGPSDLPPSLRGNDLPLTPPQKLDPSNVRLVVNRTGGNKRMAARQLGVSPTTLYRALSQGGQEPRK